MAGRRKKKLFTPARVVLTSIVLLVLVVFATWLYLQGKNVAVLDPQGIIASQQRDLIVFTTLLSIVVVVPVFTMLGMFAWKYREGNTKATYTPDVDGNRWLEFVWWGIPIVIIGILGVITWVTTHQLDPYKKLASNVEPIRVQVVALQWKWLFLYPDQGVASVNELKVPAKTPINFELTADGPMSAFWVPSLGSQIYAMNGMTSKLHLQADRPGVYRGSNTNINGTGYADMAFNVIALNDRTAFDEWTRTITSYGSGHTHLGMEEYNHLAKPSRKNKTAYYHLHDSMLFSGIIQKYMSHSSSEGTEHMEGTGH